MTTVETPREFYYRLEKQLSPVLRKTLAENLPKIGGKNWWKNCVLTSLSPIQLDNVRQEQTLEQFDYPALVNIFYHNWRNLRPLLSIGNEITNYLFSIKTLRNDVEHQPDLVLTEARKVHLEQSVCLALTLLNKKGNLSYKHRLSQKHLISFIILTTSLLAFSVTGYNLLKNNKKSDTLINNQQFEKQNNLSKDCAILNQTIKTIKKYDKILDVNDIFKHQFKEFKEKCSNVNSFENLTDDEKLKITVDVRMTVDNHVQSSNYSIERNTYADDFQLRYAYSIYVKYDVYKEGEFNLNKNNLIQRIKAVQKKYKLQETGVPSQDLIQTIERDLKDNKEHD